jgi:hypothetical protein
MKAGGDSSYLSTINEYEGPYAIRDKPIESVAQFVLDHLAEALYPNGTAQTRNRQVYTPVISVLHHGGFERKFKRPKG